MKASYLVILAAAALVTATPHSHAGLSQSALAGICKAQAQQEYAAADQSVRVQVLGIRGNGNTRSVRMKVVPKAGDAFVANCTLDTRTGQVAALEPKGSASEAKVATTRR